MYHMTFTRFRYRVLPDMTRAIPSRHAIIPPAVLLSCLLLSSLRCHAQDRGPAWTRHTIDDTSRGADGVRLADVNGDGLMDIATGWEEGGRVRAYVNPGPKRAKEMWPSVTVGEVRSPEDAVFVDLDGDGAVDVVSSCEGKVKSMFVHWAPGKRDDYLRSGEWKTEAIPVTSGMTRWMFCLPMDVDGKNGIDLVAGSKNPDGQVGWLESPENPRDLASWKWHKLCDAGWIMSLVRADMDEDGDSDVLLTDRRGDSRGLLWLENPGIGPAQKEPWEIHRIGSEDREVMFLAHADMNGDGLGDIVAAVKGNELVYHRRVSKRGDVWERSIIRFPDRTGTGKGVYLTDIDLDGRCDIAFTCEGADGKSGVMWLSYNLGAEEPHWTAHEISGMDEGVKFDRIEMLDLDADGDMDLLTCEERDDLGVIWYENPIRSPSK